MEEVTSNIDLDAVMARVKAVADIHPFPWKLSRDYIRDDDGGEIFRESEFSTHADDFIINAPADIVALVARVKELETRVALQATLLWHGASKQ